MASLEGKKGFAVVTEGANNAAVDTQITIELEAEGVAREVVHRVQTMRRSAGFDIADHIVLYYDASPDIIQILSSFADYIQQEVLADDIVEGVPADTDAAETHKFIGVNVELGVKKVG